jgi:hypothetical protein
MSNYDTRQIIRISKAEKAKWTQTAADCGLNLSDYIRQVVRQDINDRAMYECGQHWPDVVELDQP